MYYARRPLIGSASGGVYRHETRTSTKIQPCHGSALRGPDNNIKAVVAEGCCGDADTCCWPKKSIAQRDIVNSS